MRVKWNLYNLAPWIFIIILALADKITWWVVLALLLSKIEIEKK